MRNSKKLVGVITIMVTAVVGFAWWWNYNNSRIEQPRSASGEPPLAPEYVLRDLKGKLVKATDLEFKDVVTVVHFWASWCPPCAKEMPEFLKFADAARKRLGVRTVAISTDKDTASIEKFFSEKNFWPDAPLPVTILHDKDQDISARYGSTKFPETFVIDEERKIIRKLVGAQNWPEVLEWLIKRSKEKKK